MHSSIIKRTLCVVALIASAPLILCAPTSGKEVHLSHLESNSATTPAALDLISHDSQLQENDLKNPSTIDSAADFAIISTADSTVTSASSNNQNSVASRSDATVSLGDATSRVSSSSSVALLSTPGPTPVLECAKTKVRNGGLEGWTIMTKDYPRLMQIQTVKGEGKKLRTHMESRGCREVFDLRHGGVMHWVDAKTHEAQMYFELKSKKDEVKFQFCIREFLDYAELPNDLCDPDNLFISPGPSR